MQMQVIPLVSLCPSWGVVEVCEGQVGAAAVSSFRPGYRSIPLDLEDLGNRTRWYSWDD